MKKTIRVYSIVICVLLLGAIVSGCEAPTPAAAVDNRSNYEKQIELNEENAKEIAANNGVPELKRSLDYENVFKRLEYLNQGNTIGYLYLLTENGQLVRESQVFGKVTSLNSYITPMEEVILVEKGYTYLNEKKYPGTYATVEAPDVDGTYGQNVNGIFWFTPDGVYQEWVGLYLFSSERLTYVDTPLLFKQG